MKYLILYILFLTSTIFPQCNDSTITVIKGVWKNDFLMCDSALSYKNITTRLKYYDDSRGAYNRYMGTKCIGIGVVIGIAAALIPYSVKMAEEGNPSGSLIFIPLIFPGMISSSIQTYFFNESIELYNKHY